MPEFLSVYGPTVGPLGISMSDRQAFALLAPAKGESDVLGRVFPACREGLPLRPWRRGGAWFRRVAPTWRRESVRCVDRGRV
jgi:hypothetical protein